MKLATVLIFLIFNGVFTETVWAFDFVDGYIAAKANDPTFRGAGFDATINNYQADAARLAFAPSVSYSNQNSINSATSSTVGGSVIYTGNSVTIAQPIFSVDKYKQFKEAEHKNSLAVSSVMASEQDLASRLFSPIGSLVTATEALKANATKIDNLQKQAVRAKKLYEMGHGTITDQRDVEVKLQQALANNMTLLINKTNARNQIFTLTGVFPTDNDFQLPINHIIKSVPDLDELLQRFTDYNPSLKSAKSNEEISILEASRAKSQMYPTVSVNHTSTFGGSTQDRNTTMLNVTVPFDASKVVSHLAADANESKAHELRRQIEMQAELQLNQFYESFKLGEEALQSKRKAVEAAEFSVIANTKSAEAGVRTTFEVLNSIDALYQAKNDYATTVVTVANALLSLLLLSAYPTDEAVQQTQAFLFRN